MRNGKKARPTCPQPSQTPSNRAVWAFWVKTA